MPVPHSSQCSWDLVPAFQMGCFLRAALMGTNCSSPPSSSGEWTFRGIWFPAGTYTSSGTELVRGTDQGGSDKKNDDSEQVKGCKRGSVDCAQGLHRLLWNKPGT